MKLLVPFLTLFLLGKTAFAGDVARGKTLYKTCVQCHGENGMGNPDELAPKIAGQFEWYIVSSIKAFKKGVERKNPKMLPFIKNLSNQDIEDLAAYVGQLGLAQ